MTGDFGDKKNVDGLNSSKDVGQRTRPASIRKQLGDLLKSGGDMTIAAEQVVKINEDGSVVVNVPTATQIAMKLNSWALSKKGTEGLKAIQMIMEQIDGKPKQTIESTTEHSFTPKEVREQRIEELLEKRKDVNR